jgi:peptide-methionine (S)-S-oxide reductase
MGGAKANPSYREVCGGNTGHVEVYDLVFDGTEATFENLLKFFFSFHDPTTMDRQVLILNFLCMNRSLYQVIKSI